MIAATHYLDQEHETSTKHLETTVLRLKKKLLRHPQIKKYEIYICNMLF